MSLPAKLADRAVDRYGERLSGAPRVTHDAVMLELDTGAIVQARFASAEEYSIRWRFGEAEFRIDTAPLHKELSTFPNHLHGPDGAARADTLTVPGREPWENLRAVLDAVLTQPTLDAGDGRDPSKV